MPDVGRMTASVAFNGYNSGIPEVKAAAEAAIKKGQVTPVHTSVFEKLKAGTKYRKFLEAFPSLVSSDSTVARTARGSNHGPEVDKILAPLKLAWPTGPVTYAGVQEVVKAINKAVEKSPYNVSSYVKSENAAPKTPAPAAPPAVKA